MLPPWSMPRLRKVLDAGGDGVPVSRESGALIECAACLVGVWTLMRTPYTTAPHPARRKLGSQSGALVGRGAPKSVPKAKCIFAEMNFEYFCNFPAATRAPHQLTSNPEQYTVPFPFLHLSVTLFYNLAAAEVWTTSSPFTWAATAVAM